MAGIGGEDGEIVEPERAPQPGTRDARHAGVAGALDEPLAGGELVVGGRARAPAAAGRLLEVLTARVGALIEQDDPQAGLGRRCRGREAAGAATDDEHVRVIVAFGADRVVGRVVDAGDAAGGRGAVRHGQIRTRRLALDLEPRLRRGQARPPPGTAADGDQALVADAHPAEDAAPAAVAGLAQAELTGGGERRGNRHAGRERDRLAFEGEGRRAVG